VVLVALFHSRYDPNGNLATLTDDTGTASFVYDDLDRLTSATYPASQTYAYGYDAVGNITSAIGPSFSRSFTYDLADRITSAGPGGPPTPGSSTREPASHNSGWTNSQNGYTSNNSYATTSPPKNQTRAVLYGTFGFDSTIPTNATITTVTVSVEWKVSTTNSIATLGSQAYVSGSPVGSELVNTAEPLADTIQTYTVSGLTRSQLLNGTFQVRVRATRGNSNTSFTASLDRVGVTVDYTVPGAGTAPSYDDNGAMTADGTYGNRTYTHDALGRLTGVTGNGTTATYTLDGAGNRWAETVNSVTTSFDLDLSVANPTILGDGTRRYLPGSPAAGYEAAGVWWNALANHLGSPLWYVSQSGATTSPVHYDPYGLPRPGSTDPVGIGWAGEWRNTTGLTNLRYRAYDPLLGRFVSRDSLGGIPGLPQTANRYAYGLGSPLTYTDPSGHFVNLILANPGLAASFFIQITPVVGDGYGFLTGLIGFDPIAGVSLSPEERAIAMGATLLVGGGFHLLARFGDELPGVAARARSMANGALDRFRGLGQAVDRVGSQLGDLRASLRSAWSQRARLLGNEAGHLRLGRRVDGAPILSPSRVSGSEAATVRGANDAINTPYGPAAQGKSLEALAARAQVESGVTLYRTGTLGRSAGPEAQFWSLEHPSTVGFASRYGVPPENAANADFIESATLVPGAPFVTRVAPPVGPNAGGGIEVVVSPGGVRLCAFSYFGQGGCQ
jgi:RHS repeat-associated protein